MSVEEKRYTLEEAELELKKRKCARKGHDFYVVAAAGVTTPEFVGCNRCEQHWQIQTGKQVM